MQRLPAENFTHPVKGSTLPGHGDYPLGGHSLLPVVGTVRRAVYDLDRHARACCGIEGIAPGRPFGRRLSR